MKWTSISGWRRNRGFHVSRILFLLFAKVLPPESPAVCSREPLTLCAASARPLAMLESLLLWNLACPEPCRMHNPRTVARPNNEHRQLGCEMFLCGGLVHSCQMIQGTWCQYIDAALDLSKLVVLIVTDLKELPLWTLDSVCNHA
jgi:hypothetical protein